VGFCPIDFNASIVSYCDDIVILSPTKASLQKLLHICGEFGNKWKIHFNPTKSVVLCLSQNNKNEFNSDLHINGKKLEKAEHIVYLGLPIGNHKNNESFWDENMIKCKKLCMH
jgi:hypothetical protein